MLQCSKSGRSQSSESSRASAAFRFRIRDHESHELFFGEASKRCVGGAERDRSSGAAGDFLANGDAVCVVAESVDGCENEELELAKVGARRHAELFHKDE